LIFFLTNEKLHLWHLPSSRGLHATTLVAEETLSPAVVEEIQRLRKQLEETDSVVLRGRLAQQIHSLQFGEFGDPTKADLDLGRK